MKAHILEEDVVEEITKRLWLQNKIKVWRVRERIPGVGALSTPGIPDLMGWIPSILWGARTGWPMPLFIECKRLGGARRIAQIQFIGEARKDGCVAFFAESWADVVREMEKQAGIKITKG